MISQSFSDSKENFKRSVSEALLYLEEKHGFSREHAIRAILHEIAMFTGAPAPEDETVYSAMKSHGLCWEDAVRALLVSKAVDAIATGSNCIVSAVNMITEHLASAELWRHTDVNSLPSSCVTRNFVAPRIAPVVLSSTKHATSTDIPSKESSELPRKSLEVNASRGNKEVLEEVAAKLNNNAAKSAKGNNPRKRPLEASTTGTTSKPEVRKIVTRNSKRIRDTEEDGKPSSKRSCTANNASP